MCLDNPALKFTVTFSYIISKVHTRLFKVPAGKRVWRNKKQKQSENIPGAVGRYSSGVNIENKGFRGISRLCRRKILFSE